MIFMLQIHLYKLYDRKKSDYYNPTLVFHGTIIALHEKPDCLTLNKSNIRTFIQRNNCAMKNQSWMPNIYE